MFDLSSQIYGIYTAVTYKVITGYDKSKGINTLSET